MKIHFKEEDYLVEVGEVFQAKVKKGVPGTMYIVRTENGEEVHFELLEKLTNTLCLMRVNEIKTKETSLKYTDTIIENKEDIKPLDKMNKKELIAFAEEFNLDVNTKLKKKDLLKAIKESI